MAYIVMLHTQDRKRSIPLVDLEDEIVEYASEDEARNAGNSNILGEAFGFDIYKH